MTVEIKSYTDSKLSDLIKDFLSRYKEDGNYKYVNLIDTNIIQSKIIEIDYNDFNDEIKAILTNESKERVHTTMYRAIGQVFQTRRGSAELENVKHENVLKFKILNYKDYQNEVFAFPDYVKYKPRQENDEELELSEYAIMIMNNYTFKTLDDTNEVLYYSNGVYEFNGEVLIAKECEKIIPECSNHKVSEVIGIIRRRTYVNRSDFNNDFSKLVLENCLFDLETFEEKEYDKEFLTTVKFPITFDKNARCLKFINFLKECHSSPENIVTIIEEMANILTFNRHNFEISAMWIGDGSNGKSTCLKIIEGVLGKKNCSHVSIHAMQNQRFAISQLDGKSSNIYADISNRELNNLGVFKQVISGETIPAEKKNKDPFDLNSFAKHFFSANEMPDIRDNSDGAFRRIYVTKWDNQFLAGVNRIENLAETILDDEKSGIFNLMLENYRTLKKNKGFRYKQSIAKVREIIKLESDKLREFISEVLMKDPNGMIIKDKMYENYVKYCNFNACEVYSKQKFGTNLPTYGILDDVKKLDGKAKRVWIGYSWNVNSEWVKANISGLAKFL